MTIAVDLGRKATKQTNKYIRLKINLVGSLTPIRQNYSEMPRDRQIDGELKDNCLGLWLSASKWQL